MDLIIHHPFWFVALAFIGVVLAVLSGTNREARATDEHQ
jgi:hypothetical protein